MKFSTALVFPRENPINPFGIVNKCVWLYHGYDMTNTLNKYSIYDIKEIDCVNYLMSDNQRISFSFCMDETARRFLEKYKTIGVLYSGGLDSTSIIISFLKVGINPKNLFVYHTEESIKENPRFYILMKNIGINLIKFEWKELQSFDFNSDVILNGTGTGSFWINKNSMKTDDNYENLFDNWQSVVKRRCNLKNTDSFDIIKEFLSKINLNIENYFQFQKVSKIAFECYSCCYMKTLKGNHLSFFVNELFFQYFLNYLSNYKEKLNEIEKLDLKKYIFSYFDDEEYFKNKKKESSFKWYMWKEYHHIFNFPIIIDDKKIEQNFLTLKELNDFRIKIASNYLRSGYSEKDFDLKSL